MWLLAGLLLGAGAVLVVLNDQQRLHVVSASMAPTIEAGTTLWMDTGARGGAGVRPGDIVVFADPGGWNEGGTTSLITKRVLAVGGQTLSCCDPSHRLLRDGSPVAEPYLPPGTPPSQLAFEVTVPDGYLWVMGDNRSHSLDSRQRAVAGGTGMVPLSAVRGVIHR